MPPKNMISVSRKIHMPKLAASRCWPTFSKWCCRNEGCASSCGTPERSISSGVVAIDWLSNGLHLVLSLVRQPFVVVGFVIHDWNLDKVFCQRRRLDLPFQTRCLPGIVSGNLAIFERPKQVEQREKITN